MILRINNINVNLEKSVEYIDGSKKTLLFLHGFTGSAAEWHVLTDFLPDNIQCLCVDLPGFGKSGTPRDTDPYRQSNLVEIVRTIIDRLLLENVVLVGYSMGGRLAYSFAAENSSMLSGLIIESATPGIRQNDEWERRIKFDEELQRIIADNSIPDFIEYWLELDIFQPLKNIPNERYETLKRAKMLNRKTGLINSLAGFGTAVMKPVWDILENIEIPVLLAAGELDRKYVQISGEAAERIPSADVKIVPGSGHVIHYEKPEQFSSIIHKFIKDL